MKKTILIYICLLTFSFATPQIIPQPYQLTLGQDKIIVPEEISISFSSDAEKSIAEFTQKLFDNLGHSTSLNPTSAWINIEINFDFAEFKNEGYALKIEDTGIQITAKTYAGAFYALQTLRQLLPHQVESPNNHYTSYSIDALEILDYPHFEWRGSMLDPARRFLSVNYIKEHIDRMALYKLNRLHLHLSDDQGFRIEIKSRPKLTEIGSTSQVGDNSGTAYFYTQAQMLEIVHYAESRNIVVIPEIDMPGHTNAILSSYPELACGATKPWPYTAEAVGFSSLCLKEPERRQDIYNFVTDVYTELFDIFPSKWIHIGGDEAAVTSDTGYKEFMVWLQDYLIQNDKIIMGWGEMLKAELKPGALAQEWYYSAPANAIKRQADLIDTRCKYFYLDHANTSDEASLFSSNSRPLTWCSSNQPISMQWIYEAELRPDSLILGGEAPLFGERIVDTTIADTRLWPRLSAFAEKLWTLSLPSFNDFQTRILSHGARLDHMGIHFWKSEISPWTSSTFPEKAQNAFSDFESPSFVTPISQPSKQLDFAANQLVRIYDIDGNLIFEGNYDELNQNLASGNYLITDTQNLNLGRFILP